MKIEPKYVDGEPWCDEENCNHSYIQDVDCKYMCRYQSPGHLPLDDFSTPCIPALRRDRDQAIKERDGLRCCGNCVEFEHEDCREDENCRVWQAMQDPWLTCIDWQPRPDLFEGGE